MRNASSNEHRIVHSNYVREQLFPDVEHRFFPQHVKYTTKYCYPHSYLYAALRFNLSHFHSILLDLARPTLDIVTRPKQLKLGREVKIAEVSFEIFGGPCSSNYLKLFGRLNVPNTRNAVDGEQHKCSHIV